jgi:hypothetical protein
MSNKIRLKKKPSSISGNAEKIINKGNWFIVQIIEKLEPARVKRGNTERLCTVWTNWHLIKAPNAEKAFAKAEKLGRSWSYTFTNSDKEQMRWEFVGIGDLLPIYEDIEDKAELMYSDHGDISLRDAKNLVSNKRKLLRNIKPMKANN